MYLLWDHSFSSRLRTSVSWDLVKVSNSFFFGFSSFLQPAILKKLLDYHVPNQSEIDKLQAYLYSAAIVALSLFYILVFHTTILKLYNLGMKLRIACSSLLFRRCLKMKKHTLQNFTTGKIINLLSNDVYRFDLLFSYFHYMWMGPFKLIVSTYYIYSTFGYTAMGGIGVILVSLLVQSMNFFVV